MYQGDGSSETDSPGDGGLRQANTRSAARAATPSYRRPSLKASQFIIASLRANIASGRLPRSSRLPNEKELAAQFRVSQPTVREALRALDAMGLIEVRHGSGAYVTGDTRNLITRSLQTLLQIEGVGILEVLDLRRVLGQQTARAAALHANEDDARSVAAARDAITAAEDLDGLWEAVLSFQVAISAATHSPLLFAFETFLTELILQFQIDAFQDAGMEFWRHWTSSVADERDKIVEILNRASSRDVSALVAAVGAYLYHQEMLFASNPKLAGIRLSDPRSIETLADPLFAIPDYRGSIAGPENGGRT